MGAVKKAAGSLFGGGAEKMPSPPPLPAPTPAPVQTTDPRIQAARDKERKRAASGGRANSVFTSGKGLDEPANTGKKTILGY